MALRSLGSESAMDGAPAKRQRLDDGRVKLDVGGSVFTTTIETLTLNSRYFKNVLDSDHFASSPERELFLDRDAESFGVLLKCMRLRSIVPLPTRTNQELCKAVL